MPAPADIPSMIALIREGKREGFDLLYANYAAALYGMICKITEDKSTAENLLETVFVTICKHIEQYNSTDNFFIWMLHIMRSACKDHTLPASDPVVIHDENNCRENDILQWLLLDKRTVNKTKKGQQMHTHIMRAEIRNQLKSFR